MNTRTMSARGMGMRTLPTVRPSANRSCIVQAVKEGETVKTIDITNEVTGSAAPSWLPEPLVPVLNFFQAENVKWSDVTRPVTESGLYKQYAAEYVESPVAKQSVGWKQLPEAINGRLAMVGFVAGALAEILGAGSILNQFAYCPQAVVGTIAIFTAASIIPVYKGTKGDYLQSLRDNYSIPEGVFTETKEKIHGRIAMLGLTSLIAIEMITGHALL